MMRPMRLKISHLPNGVRVQTNKPYANHEKSRWHASVMVITEKDGARGIIVPLDDNNYEVEEVWMRIHRASVKAVCQHFQQNPELVSHLTDKDLVIQQDRTEVSTPAIAIGERPKTSSPRRWTLGRR